MNNKGFAVTGMLYIILLIFIAMYTSLLIMFANRRKIYDNIKDEVMNGSTISERARYLSTLSVGEYVSYPIEYTNANCVTGSNNNNSGWRILSIDDNVVTIISGGTPECYNPSTFTDSGAASKTKIESLLSDYLNTDYATSIRNFNGTDFLNITSINYSLCYNVSSEECGNNNDLISTGSYYWLSDNYNTSTLYYWNPTNKYLSNTSNVSYGIRPVIELKSNITYTDGSGSKSDPYILKID